MLDKLIKNKGIQRILLNQFNDIIETEGIKTIVIKIGDNKELIPELYTKEMVVLDKEVYVAIMEKLKTLNV